ncbi:hypothetical protein KPK_1223 [Klebsiella variicola]|uniref:Uncharacterized protein n=1 Tax=Klebsiella variicola (strain 342) TaxID=507522 RepID=B5XNG3_KLEV3|nr:hypothetical protein KPK_1223 [Klebsiella variicola]
MECMKTIKFRYAFVFCLATAADRYQSLYAQVAKQQVSQ